MTDKNRELRELKDAAEIARLQELSVHERDDMGFANSKLIQATFPYRDTGERQWTSTNGGTTIIITALSSKHGLPYGTYPRLLMIWLTGKVVENANSFDPEDPARRKIFFGNHLAAFMKELGIDARYGSHTDLAGNVVISNSMRLAEQIRRVFNLNINIESLYALEDKAVESYTNTIISQNLELYWDKHSSPEQYSLLDSYVVLSEEFFDFLKSRPVPVDLGILRKLKSSAMALDLYVWITYRAFYAHRPFAVTVPDLMRQFGTTLDPDKAADRRNFMVKFKRAVKKIHKVWPETAEVLKNGEEKLHVIPRGKGLRVYPMNTSVPPKEGKSKKPRRRG